jgi:hypothetical protein
MLKGFGHLDIDGNLELVRLAEQVEASGLPCILRRNGKEIAALVPTKAIDPYGPSRVRTEEDYAATRSAAGGWADIDTDELVLDVYDGRGPALRPRVKM